MWKRTIVSSCTSVSVDTEDTVRSVLTVLELVLDPWRPELELLAGVTLVLELDIVTLTISSISISILSRYLQIYNSISIWISCVVSVSQSAVSSNYRPVAGTLCSNTGSCSTARWSPHCQWSRRWLLYCTLYRLCCIYYLPPLQWISKTWKGHGHSEHWMPQTCLWEPSHQLQILRVDKRWCCCKKILVCPCIIEMHLFIVN